MTNAWVVLPKKLAKSSLTERPVPVGQGIRRDTVNLTFTHISMASYNRIQKLVGIPIIYRDQFNNRFFGEIRSNENEPFRRNLGRFDAVVDYTLQITVTAHDEVIPYV